MYADEIATTTDVTEPGEISNVSEEELSTEDESPVIASEVEIADDEESEEVEIFETTDTAVVAEKSNESSEIPEIEVLPDTNDSVVQSNTDEETTSTEGAELETTVESSGAEAVPVSGEEEEENSEDASAGVEEENNDEPTATSSEVELVIEEAAGGANNEETAETENDVTLDPVTTEILLATTSEATSTSEIIFEEPVNVTYSDTELTFNKQECTELASGSFYCLHQQDNVLDDALFSAPDVDGDLEIFLVRGGVQTQVTSNVVDDAAPYYDQNSDSLVWHRLLDDRYQIISYDISSGEEEQLTHNNTNDMEPTRQGKYTVWQRWTDNNWNVVLYDGKQENVITESVAHDIAPYIHGSLVVWNRYNAAGDKTIEMYDIASQTYVTVNDPEGLSVTNPRMVFVYDSLHPNGDVVTKGFDMITRQFIQLDTLPKPLPDEIPESDSTGETRALIQSKPTLKTDEIKQADPASGSDGLMGTTTEAILTLDLSSPATSTEMVVPSEVGAEFELIIPPLELVATNTESVQE